MPHGNTALVSIRVKHGKASAAKLSETKIYKMFLLAPRNSFSRNIICLFEVVCLLTQLAYEFSY
jgi:hypothetical protein